MTPASRMVNLFIGNQRSTGRWDPHTERMYAEYLAMDEETMAKHLDGEFGVGVVPIDDEHFCKWAAIDIDNHDTDEDIPIRKVDEDIRRLGLPLISCRSKSGGVHAYLFLKDKQQVSKIRPLMEEFATKLGYGGSEIFPKQTRLTGTDRKSFGNWINLPYFHAKETVRYAIVNGKKLTLIEFLDTAESTRVSSSQLDALTIADHTEAPPCVQRMFIDGVPQGQRNEAMYNVSVYFRKHDKDTAEADATRANSLMFKTPLPKQELMRTVTSAMNPEYSYRCGEDVMRSRCDRPTCIKRRFGVTPTESENFEKHEALPHFDELIKYVTEPVRWELRVENIRIFNISTAQLLDWRSIRELLADRLTRVVPMIKNSEWERLLQPLMREVRLVDAPDDASVNGVIRDRLREFACKADLMNRGESTEDRKNLIRGMPIVQQIDGERCVVFRAQDFVNYLKRTKSEELKGTNLWFAISELGVMHKKLRIPPNGTCMAWFIPVEKVVINMGAEPVEFKSEL